MALVENGKANGHPKVMTGRLRERSVRKGKGFIMLRGFIRCITRKERIAYMMDNRFGNWTDSELASVMQIVGVRGDFSNATKEDKIKAIVATLKMNRDDKAQFDRVQDNGKAINDMDAMKDSIQYTRVITNLYSKSSQLG